MRSLVSSHFDYNLTSRGHFFSLHIQNGIVQVLPCGPVVIYDRRKICQKSVLHNNIQSKEKKGSPNLKERFFALFNHIGSYFKGAIMKIDCVQRFTTY